jgi:glutamate-ammonia-ligase adenylyltransferase
MVTVLTAIGDAYRGFSAAEQALHLDLLARVTAAEPLAFDVRARTDGSSVITVCAPDRVGALSLIAGALTAARLNIESADLFTLRVPVPPGAPRRGARGGATTAAEQPTVGRLLDVFTVRPGSPGDERRWTALREEIAELLRLLASGEGEEARTRIVDAVSEAMRRDASGGDRLWPIAVDTSMDGGQTRLRITGQDTVGFLFELANALALLDVDIVGGEIRTVGGETRDILVIAGPHGEPLREEGRLRQVRAAVVLIKQFTALLPHAPDPAQALRQFGALTRQLLATPDWANRLEMLTTGEVQHTLAEVMGASTFLWEDFLRMQHASLFPLVGDMAALDHRAPRMEVEQALAEALSGASTPDAVRSALNAFKDREMFRIDLRHITGRVGFEEFADELSDLAEVVVGAAARLAYDDRARRAGTPRLRDGRVCPWSVLALGKFGGREIGFASDVELLFAFEGEGSTDGAPPEPNDRYFEAWVRLFMGTLLARKSGIFEVDLRLRPHGDAGPLASSLDGLRAYYRPGGGAQQFERLALVKLRAVGGDAALGRAIEAIRDGFVYSGAPIDLDAIAHMRVRQASELVPGSAVSAKHSAGGVVDIEYWVQAQQIQVGADDVGVRATSTLAGLRALAAGGHIDSGRAAELADAYSFLRRLIDALRVVRGDARDLTIPARGSRAFAYLSRRLELEPEALDAAIERHMGCARALWSRHAR